MTANLVKNYIYPKKNRAKYEKILLTVVGTLKLCRYIGIFLILYFKIIKYVNIKI